MNIIRYFVPPAILIVGVVIVSVLATLEAISPGAASACTGFVYIAAIGAGIYVYRRKGG